MTAEIIRGTNGLHRKKNLKKGLIIIKQMFFFKCHITYVSNFVQCFLIVVLMCAKHGHHSGCPHVRLVKPV